jgi:putative ABC transport system ATP-binding protein
MVDLKDITHHYDSNTAVSLPDLQVEKGGELLVIGLSGSGKSTLLHILAGVLKPTKGTLSVNGTDLYRLSESKRDAFRGKNIGVIFQQMHLVDSLTVTDNLKLAQFMAGVKVDIGIIKNICIELDITDKLHSYPDELSQGQKQRVSIARALVNAPSLLLADEPTSSLDDRRSEDVVALLKRMAEKTGATLIISTHDARVKKHFSNVLNLDIKKVEVV